MPNAPHTQPVAASGRFTWISRTAPASSVTTASKAAGFSTGNSRNASPSGGSAAKPSAGNQTVSGSPTSTRSSGCTNGAARKIASQRPSGSGCTT